MSRPTPHFHVQAITYTCNYARRSCHLIRVDTTPRPSPFTRGRRRTKAPYCYSVPSSAMNCTAMMVAALLVTVALSTWASAATGLPYGDGQCHSLISIAVPLFILSFFPPSAQSCSERSGCCARSARGHRRAARARSTASISTIG